MRAARLLIFFPTLFLIASSCVAAPRPQEVHEWNSQVDSLASKIVANFEKTDSISLAVTNISSLSAAAVAEIRASLQKDLQQRGLRLASAGGNRASVEVTLSENLYEVLWAAKIRHGESERIEFVSFPRVASLPNVSAEMGISLQREIVWQESAKILDFAAPAGLARDDAALVVLEPERLAFYKSAGTQLQLDRAVSIAHSNPWPRDLRGKIDLPRGAATLPGVACEGTFEHAETVRCVETPDSKESTSAIAGTTASIGGRSVEAATLGGACGMDSLLVASGTGDRTVPDTIHAYAEADHQLTPLGNTLEIPGPVLAMWPADDGKSARVISRNLQTGMYEASIVSVACNR